MDATAKSDTALEHRVQVRGRETPVLQSSAWRSNRGVPGPAKMLGIMGLVPFVGLACALWVVPPDRLDELAGTLTSYAAVILAFMGAIHWGLTIASECRQEHGWYALGVLPALTGWGATMLSPATAMAVLAAAFGGVFALDLMAIRAGLAPPWYRKLRQPLTVVVVASLTLGAIAVRVSVI